MTQSYPKHFLFLIVIIVTVSLLFSCGKSSEQTTETQKTQTDTINAITTPVISTNQSELLKMVITPQGGDFRGFKFGDPLSKIKAEEKFELFEDSTDHVGFTHETENFEAIDVLYYLDGNQALNSIRVDIYLNDANAVRNLADQFDTYLSGKYNPEKKEAKSTVWRGRAGTFIVLEDVSKEKDYGLKLSIGPQGSPALAKSQVKKP
jgi:hypothetical protein